jgi:II/X family phage/plasmid replication protein
MDIKQAKLYLETLQNQVSSTLMTVGTSKYSLLLDLGLDQPLQIDSEHALNIRREAIRFLKLYIANIDTPIHQSEAFQNLKASQPQSSSNAGMIDWFRGEILFTHKPLPAGHFLSVDYDGSIEYQADKKFHSNVGSFETSIKLKSNNINSEGFATTLMIDGNPSKFLQGHNVFGSLDLNQLLLKTFNRIIQRHTNIFSYTDSFTQLRNIAKAEQAIEQGDYLVKMLDINFIYELDTDLAVNQWLYAAALNARSQSGGATKSKTGNTVYIQQNSRRWAVKFYNKFTEITSLKSKHKLPPELAELGLAKFAEGKLRSELRLMSLELKDLGITHGRHLSPDVLTGLYCKYLEKVQMKPNKTLLSSDLQKMPASLANTYRSWKEGTDIQSTLKPSTYYRHRSKLIEYGVDISIPPISVDIPNNVVPMLRVIEAKPVENPQWAYEKGLIAV